MDIELTCCEEIQHAERITDHHEKIVYLMVNILSIFQTIFYNDHACCFDYFLSYQLDFQNIDSRFNLVFFLQYACEYDSLKCLYLFDKKFSTFDWNSKAFSIMYQYVAPRNQNVRSSNEVLNFLLERGVDINYNNGASLFSAIFYQNFMRVKLLIAHGVDFTARNNQNQTPIEYFLKKHANTFQMKINIFWYLLSIGAKVKQKTIIQHTKNHNYNRITLIRIHNLFKKIDYLKFLWEMQNFDHYTNIIQWLPNELLCDLNDFLSSEKISLPPVSQNQIFFRI